MLIIHRYGNILVNVEEKIVLVATFSMHRKAISFKACNYIMDYSKKRCTFLEKRIL